MENQNTDNKRIVKNTIMLYIRMVLLMLVNLYTSRVLLRILGVDDYGLYAIVGSLVIFLGFINGAMTASSQRFLSFYQGKGDFEELSSTFNSVLVVQFFISLLILVIGEVVGVIYIQHFLNVAPEKLKVAHIVYQFSLLSFVIKTLSVPYTASIISNERMNVFALLSILETSLQLVVVIILQTIIDNRLIMYAFMMFMSVVIVQFGYRIYSIRCFKECEFRKNWQRKTIKDIFSYSGWNLIGMLSSVAIDEGTNIILNFFFGVVVNAARAIAYQVSNAIGSLSGNFQQALNPQIVKTYSSGELDKMYQLIMKGSRFCFYLLLILSMPVIFNMRPLLELWLGSVPDYTESFCKLILVNTLICAFPCSLVMGAMATGHIMKYQIVIALINMLNILSSIIILSFYRNPLVTAYVMIVIDIISCMTKFVLASRIINLSLSLFVQQSVLPAVFTVFIAVIGINIINIGVGDNCVWMLIFRLFVFFIVTVLSVIAFGVTQEERLWLWSFIKRKYNNKFI